MRQPKICPLRPSRGGRVSVLFPRHARGTYAGAPISAHFTGGAVLAIADATTPWPVTLEVMNGTTRASLRGTLINGLALGGADLRLALAGPDMRFLRPLTGVPIPSTPPFRVAGRLDYGAEGFRFTEIQGQVGHSDLGGSVTIDPRSAVPEVTAELTSRQVDLADLAGFIGGNPGRGVPIRADSTRTGLVLPNAPVNLPLFRAANVRAHFCASSILGEDSPLDTLDVTLEVRDGVVTLKPLRGGVGHGAVIVTGTITPNAEGSVHAVGDVVFQQMDIGRLMQALGGRGGGALDGRGRIDAVGRSTAELLARGNGALRRRPVARSSTAMTASGNSSASERAITPRGCRSRIGKAAALMRAPRGIPANTCATPRMRCATGGLARRTNSRNAQRHGCSAAGSSRHARASRCRNAASATSARPLAR